MLKILSKPAVVEEFKITEVVKKDKSGDVLPAPSKEQVDAVRYFFATWCGPKP